MLFSLRMKLRLFFILIIIYVIAAFGWLTYSLVSFSINEAYMKNQILKAGRQACILGVIEQGKNEQLRGRNTSRWYLKQIELEIDTSTLNQYLHELYFGSFVANYTQVGNNNHLSIEISPSKMEEIDQDLNNKIRLHVFQAILLTILVGAGIYGVYYSVNTLYNLNKQQTNFLLSVTHEFKTPIASVKLMLQTIMNRDLPREKQLELLDKAIQNSDRLNELTENMLTAMQIEKEKYNYDHDEFSVTDLMNNVVASYIHKNEITADLQDNVLFKGDRFVLRISVNNLVENAIKYSDEKPVHLKLIQDKNWINIEVHDQGIGIPKRFRNKIFKRFYRIQDEETRDTKGTGLGLYIVQQVVKKHKGKVVIEDNKPAGTIFIIKLPVPKK